jgi:hypothetical protein
VIGGYIQLSRTADAAIMIRIEEPIPTMASQLRTRARPAVGMACPAVAELELAPVALRMRLLLQPSLPGFHLLAATAAHTAVQDAD